MAAMNGTNLHDPNAAARRRLRILAAVLLGLLVCSLICSAALWIALDRAREELAQAEEPPRPKSRVQAQAVELSATPAPPERPAEVRAPAPASVAPPEDRLLLLLTVGTRHYAEKQLRQLRKHCRAPLAVYLQRRGRCAWSQCFAVAAREADADLARGCGATKGQALRERTDFALIE